MKNENTPDQLMDLDYPSWSQDSAVPVTRKEIRAIFDDLTKKFGFQESSKENILDHLLTQLDSRASRMGALSALISLHVSYIGGEHANYRKWYFAAQLDLDEEIGIQNMQLSGKSRNRNLKMAKKRGVSIKQQLEDWKVKEQEFINNHRHVTFSKEQLRDKNNLKVADYKWKTKMRQLSSYEMVRQLSLYLLCWGEANNVRFAPECLCFIFKCALDYDSNTINQPVTEYRPLACYLEEIITPLYNFMRKQSFRMNSSGNWVRKEQDHKNIIGYDDMNQLFWYPEGLERIKLFSGERLIDKPPQERYCYLKDVEWSKVFYKTYFETRSWMHCATNFNRFWIIHFAPFWFFTAFNSPVFYTKNYNQLLNNGPTPQSRLSAVAFGGTITCLVQIFATLFEWKFVPREWPGAQHLTLRMIGLSFLLVINVGPSVYTFGFFELDTYSKSAFILSIIQLIIGIGTTFFFAVMPLGGLFRSYLKKDKKKRRYISSQTFTASFPKLSGRSKWFSYGLWIFVFLCKYIESYFFLTLSLRDPIRVLSILDIRCNGDKLINTVLCKYQSKITVLLMIFADLGLFFLDTYLWYIICNCIFSIFLSFSLGTSIFTPWKNIYSKLPERIYSKILATNEMNFRLKSQKLTSEIWNAVIISMYREHLLAIEHVQKLLYQKADRVTVDAKDLKTPTFFVAQDDSTFKSVDFFPAKSEAKRRISFFAQSLSTPITEPLLVESMPTFSVLIPHYGEKILLNLKEIIKEESFSNRMTVLEYLKLLYPSDWKCFIRDTKLVDKQLEADNIASREIRRLVNLNNSQELLNPTILTESGKIDESDTTGNSKVDPIFLDTNGESFWVNEKIKDLPLYAFGFSKTEALYTMRTRAWASLRTQTLYRTISGFMNYLSAIKLLYQAENPSVCTLYGADADAIENEFESMAIRKFKMVVAMQRYAKFNEEELEATEFILRKYPMINISYILEEFDQERNDCNYFSCLTNGYCKLDEDTMLREPVFKIKLSGNPILGDGKADNQNHSIIFYRGEYIQVIDANQDNYLEECLKIRSVLSEFEELEIDSAIPYIAGVEYDEEAAPVAFVGAREYIFSENIGVLGDIAAGKEQTFGTLFARTLAEIGGKLHYGHPDFINAIFMTTRGGISKAQKGLHLNEDIYAGINAICRGGRIKHSDYYQCGKGRDLGFSSILNFTTKIGAGMGEQLLSREYYYLGTQLPIDRFLTFFYAHPGFHLNNLFISTSIQLFFTLLNLGSLNYETIVCMYDKNASIIKLEEPLGCANIKPALNWVSIFVLSIFIVFFIAFAPLLIQELLEKGLWKSLSRFTFHIISLAPLFEVFVCQIYSSSLLTDITFGGAKYISTGRGFAITRIPFATLYSRYVTTSIYSGLQIFLMLLFGTVSMWQPALLWFWITVISLCFAPFIFNPHQFRFTDFFIDYRNTFHWFSTGNSSYKRNSWSTFTKITRGQFTGYKRKILDDPSEEGTGGFNKIRFLNVLTTELLMSFFYFFFNFTAYMFINSQTGVRQARPTDSITRLVLVTILPILFNMVVLIVFFFISLIAGPLATYCKIHIGTFISFVVHALSILIYIIDFELMWFLQEWCFCRTLMLLLTSVNLQTFIFKLITSVLLPKEYKNNKSHLAWWTGNWYSTGLGWSIILQPFREFSVKIMESSFFAGDFFITHFLLYMQTPLLFFPFIDYWHSMILFWLNPTHINKYKRVYSKKQKKLRNSIIKRYFLLYILILLSLLTLFIVPFFAHKFIPEPRKVFENITFLHDTVQPFKQDNNDTGPNAPSTILRAAPPMPVFKTVN
ncbi:putative 1,3-beta-D-glucan synthase NDAI_0I02550 [Naumovozyma dairenensis CBS 421]|uniref:1,3-beta-glucan synthase n=1 Tax=Naumovozyma dairenensis (strain ATCC 10597 / BCRC 20456 / CBS 421 / NBRC 0211 / NRRL Y-12639) TaxID=1071378 RepID=G0WGB2_NAUDC|nr:hypothetical protein NDAI_0I02550 [Naumovozyma dairenensis CBS 421]CCD26823.1 hypothetical protein NDAI_0I02550 [Naumovozyma dairenensis CBS 421]